jgi:Xaa-Pro aminopeptidase
LTRADRLAARVAEGELDALLVTDPVDVRYLTGFTGTNALVVVGAGDGARRVFVTDFRYVGRAATEVGEQFERVTGERDLLGDVAAALPPGAATLGFDDAKTTVRTHGRLAELLGDHAELVAADGLVGDLRMVKEEGELESICIAAKLADDALSAVLERGLVGRTEREIAFDLAHEIRLRGSQPSFPPIVAAGVHSDQPHAEPGDEEIARDVLVTIDWGASADGYCSDCTRTYATGSVDDEALEVYELVRQAQAVALESVRAGVLGRDADAAARTVIEGAGHGEQFGHGLGHGVGLEVHEEPRLSKAGDVLLAAGMVVTVEPGVYLPGRFGVRIEDLVIVRDDGGEILSSLPKELTRID